MARASSDASLDRLYQVPLPEFISARNALAKERGADGAEIRSLQKPSLPAWAVNQLYWRQRPVYDALLERADDLRATHSAALAGKRTDLRGAGKAHEEAIEAALKATLALLAGDGHAVTDATKQAIATTLRSLPGDDAPGRLTRQLEPRGFEMFAGAAAQGKARVVTGPPPAKSKAAAPSVKTSGAKGKEEAARTAERDKLAAAREAVTAATRAARQAEQVARREEFEAARAVRDADKAEQQADAARTALEQARAELAAAEKAATAAGKARDAARKRAAAAADEMEDARGKEENARAALDKLT